MRNNEIKNEIDEIKKWEEEIKRKDLQYETKKYIHDFKRYETIRSCGNNIYTDKISIAEPEIDQSNLLKSLVKFNNRSRPKKRKVKIKKVLTKVHILFMNIVN